MRDEIARTLGTEVRLRRAVRDAFRVRGVNHLERMRLGAIHPLNVGEVCRLEDEHHLLDALGGQRGAIVLVPRFGLPELVAIGLNHRGWAVHQLAAGPRDLGLPIATVAPEAFPRPAWRALDRGEVVIVPFETGGSGRVLSVRLGRRMARVPTRPWQIARSTGAPVVPALVVRDREASFHRVVFAPPIRVPRSAARDADLRAVETFAGWYTGWLDRRPDHYAPYLLERREDPNPLFVD
jgi:lauroyl/myristoyl acyltransferase